MYHPDSFNTTFLSQGCNIGAASGSNEDEKNAHSKDSEGVRNLQIPGLTCRSTRCQVFLMTSSNNEISDLLIPAYLPGFHFFYMKIYSVTPFLFPKTYHCLPDSQFLDFPPCYHHYPNKHLVIPNASFSTKPSWAHTRN